MFSKFQFTRPTRKLLPFVLLTVALSCTPETHAQTATGATKASPQTMRDGQHDFDFNMGTWRTHIRRLVHPLSSSSEWTELNGTVTVHPIWDGQAQIEEIAATGPKGGFKGATLFLYNPDSHQWSQTFVSQGDDTLSASAIGEFKDGRGELYDQETFRGRAILVRAVWSDITPDSHNFEQSFSSDGGKTWEPNFVATLTRLKD